MADADAEPTQDTQPVKGKPVKIPIPKRGDVFRDLEKVTKKKAEDD